MHKIIDDMGKPLGGKADNLIKLDDYHLTPDFVVIPHEVLESAFGVSPIKEFPAEIIDNILDFLGSGPLIARSSYCGEDSTDASYAGIFLSELCKNSKDLPDVIKRVWNSRDTGYAMSYHAEKKSARMNVIVQKYVNADYGGVMFHWRSRKMTYCEIAPGGAADIVNGSVMPESYLNHAHFSLISKFGGIVSKEITRIREIEHYADMFSEHIKNNNIDIEFCVKGNSFYLLQARPVTADLDPYSASYIFPSPIVECGSFHPDDADKGIVLKLVSEFGLDEQDFQEESIPGVKIKKLFESLEKNVYSGEAAGKFEALFIYMKKALIPIARRINSGISDEYDLLMSLKKINFYNTFFESILNYCKSKIYLKDSAQTEILSNMSRKVADILRPFSYWIGRKIGGGNLEANEFFSMSGQEVIKRLGCHKGRYAPQTSSNKNIPVNANKLEGIVASLGYAEGKALLADDIVLGGGIRSGSILVLRDSELKSVFPEYEYLQDRANAERKLVNGLRGSIKGIICENGGILSHAAIIARELKIPCLVSCKGCMEHIRTGDYISIRDGFVFLA